MIIIETRGQPAYSMMNDQGSDPTATKLARATISRTVIVLKMAKLPKKDVN